MEKNDVKEIIWCKEQGDSSLPSAKEMRSETSDSMKKDILSYLKDYGYHDDQYYWYGDLIRAVEDYNVSLPEYFRNHILSNGKKRAARHIALRLINKIILDFSFENKFQYHLEINKKGILKYKSSEDKCSHGTKAPEWIMDCLKEDVKDVFLYDSEKKSDIEESGFHWKISFYNIKGNYYETEGHPGEISWRTESILEFIRRIEKWTDLNFRIDKIDKEEKRETINYELLSGKSRYNFELQESDSRKISELSEALLNSLMNRNENANILISPVSIFIIVAILAKASSGNSAEQICKLVGLDSDKIWEIATTINNGFSLNGKTISLANSLFVSEKYKDFLVKQFEDLLKQDLSTETFHSLDSVDQINNWVQQKTRKMIPRLINDMSQLGDIAAINAVAFESKWLKRYDTWDIDEGIFHSIYDEDEKVVMLKSNERFYVYDEYFTGFIKPYMEHEFAYMALLPSHERMVGEVIKDISPGKIFDLYQSAFNAKVKVTMPEFELNAEEKLTDILSTFGVTDIFDGKKADFRNMIQVSGSYISEILHKTRIEVNRSGTRAAAVTGMIAVAGCAPIMDEYEITLDRPFIFSIIHMPTGIPVFLGVVNSINK